MIARILDGHGIGIAMAAILYIAGKLNHKGVPRDDVVHLFGDGQQVIDVTESMTCKHRYLSSVLSFTKEESERLTTDQVHSLAEALAEHHAYPFGTNNISGCAYLHIQDGRYDVHLIQAQCDLESGKRVDLYLDSCGDTHRIAAWQDIQNFELALDDPRDPSRQRLTKERIQEAVNRKEMRSLINSRLERMHINGEINSRADVCSELESLGFEIARKTKSSLSIISPDLNKNIRLTGEIYNESYSGLEGSRDALEESKRRTREDRQKQYDEARTRLAKANLKRTVRLSCKLKIDLAGRLQRPPESAEAEATTVVLDAVLAELSAPRRHTVLDSAQAGALEQQQPIDGLSDHDLPGTELRHRTLDERPENSGWSVPNQGEIGVNDESSQHEITDPFASYVRDQNHAQTMRRLSSTSRSIDRASQRIGRTGGPNGSASATTRGGFIETIA